MCDQIFHCVMTCAKQIKKNHAELPLPNRLSPPRHQMPDTTKKTASKKSTKLSPAIIKERREVIEKRILKLESKLNKDRALLLRYVVVNDEEEPVV